MMNAVQIFGGISVTAASLPLTTNQIISVKADKVIIFIPVRMFSFKGYEVTPEPYYKL